METKQESIATLEVDSDSRASPELYNETLDSFDSEVHLVSVDRMLNIGKCP